MAFTFYPFIFRHSWSTDHKPHTSITHHGYTVAITHDQSVHIHITSFPHRQTNEAEAVNVGESSGSICQL